MKVVTFYSFRGGVGRSLAVANVAYAMVESGERRVLVVDFDLEAPGLSFMDFLQPEKPAPKGGVFEFAKSYQSGRSPDLADYISPVKDKPKNLYFMRAGNLESGYDVSELDINRLLSPKRRRVNFVDYLRAQAESLRFHYVLVDSRTGLTELGGMCTVGLPDLVVVLTGLNQQNREGTRWVLQNIRTHGRDPNQVIVVFSHLPDSEEQLRNDRMTGALRFLEVRQSPIFLPYHPRMSLVEELFVRSWPDRPLAVAYRDLARAVRERNEEDIESLLDAITREAERPVTSADRAVREGVAPDRRVPADLEALARRALALFPDSARVAHALGRAYATLGLFPEALPLLETSAGGPEGSGPRDQGLLLTCAVRAGDTQAAARQIGRLRALLLSRRFGKPPWDLSEALGYVRRALPSMRELQRRELDGSVAVPALRLLIDLARSLLVRSPDEHQKAALYNNIALYLLLLHYYQPEAQHPKRAIGFARKAVHLDPRHGRYNIACALALLGRRKQALDALGNLSTEELKQADPRTDRDWQAYWDDPEFKEILVRAEGKDGPASRQAPGDPSPPGQRRRASARPSSRRR